MKKILSFLLVGSVLTIAACSHSSNAIKNDEADRVPASIDSSDHATSHHNDFLRQKSERKSNY